MRGQKYDSRHARATAQYVKMARRGLAVVLLIGLLISYFDTISDAVLAALETRGGEHAWTPAELAAAGPHRAVVALLLGVGVLYPGFYRDKHTFLYMFLVV